MSSPTPEQARTMLEEIRQVDPDAADLGLQRLQQLEASGGNVELWTSQIELALTGVRQIGRTRLADIARHEMGLPQPQE